MIRKRIRYAVPQARGSCQLWRQKLAGIPCFILGNGPSLDDNPVAELLADYFTIGINKAYLKLDPTILLWQDQEFYFAEKRILPKLSCVKYCRDIADMSGHYHHFRLVCGPFQVPKTPMTLFGCGTSGPLAFELAWLLGCNPIVLLGMDCQYRDGKTDFYGKNHYHKPHTLSNCGKGLRWIKSLATERKIINCSDNTVFPERYSLSDALDMIGYEKLNKKTGREAFVSAIYRITP